MGKGLLQKADVLLVQGEDPWQQATSEIVVFTKCLLRTFGSRVAVATLSEEPLPVGRWLSRPFEGRELAYYNLGPLGLVPGRKPLVPARVHVYRRIRQHIDTLHASGVRNLLLNSGEALFAAKWSLWDSVCYCFHGLSNPVPCSRYRWARGFGGLYQRWLLNSLRVIGPDAVIVAADEPTCEVFRKKSRKYVDPSRIHSFPARVDTSTAEKYSVEDMARDLGKIWKPLAPKSDLQTTASRLPVREAA